MAFVNNEKKKLYFFTLWYHSNIIYPDVTKDFLKYRDAIQFLAKIFVDDGKFIKCSLTWASGLHISFQRACDISFGRRTEECGMRLESGVREEGPESRRAARDIRYISLDEAT